MYKSVKKIFHWFAGLAMILILSSSSILLANAQGNVFDTLDDLKSNVEGNTGRVNEEGKPIVLDIIDFSEDEPWGNLSPDTVLKLRSSGIKNLEHLQEEAGYLDSKKNDQDLREFIKGLGFSQVSQNGPVELNDEGNLIANEIIFKGERQIRSIVLAVIRVIRNLAGALAVLWIVINGIQIIFSGGDDSRTKELQQGILYAVVGLIIILLIEQIITGIYGVPGAERGIGTNGPGINLEIFGIVSFIRAILASLAVFFIIISGIGIVASQGNEEQLKKQRQSIVWIAVGIILILVDQVIIENLYSQPVRRIIENNPEIIAENNVQNIIGLIGQVVQFALGFVGLIAFGVFIYAGANMIINYGDDEQVTKSRKLMTNAIVGIIIILSAFAIIATVINFP